MKTKLKTAGTFSPTPNTRRGFTLVELLVVITIIAVLAGAIFALTQKIREKAYQANAVSALRQVAIASVAYSTDNNGDINVLRDKNDPLEGNNLKGIGDAWVKNTFWGRLQPNLFPDVGTNNQGQLNKNLKMSLARLYNTPDLTTMANTSFKGVTITGDVSGLPVPFAFSQSPSIYKWGDTKKISAAGDPAQLLYMTYGAYRFDRTDGKVYVPMPQRPEKAKANIYFLNDKKALGAFLDGHIEALSAPIPDRMFN